MIKRSMDPVANAIALHGVKGRLNLGDVLLFYTRSEYVTGDGLNSILQEVDQTLEERGVPDISRKSTLNIIIELAFNSVIHSEDDAVASELLVIAQPHEHVSVSMFGGGHPAQINRLERIVESVRRIATPPHHQTKMLEQRDKDAWRRRNEAESASKGGGLGILTIAALSSQELYFLRKPENRKERFVLQSVV
jgi:hypothetical protein